MIVGTQPKGGRRPAASTSHPPNLKIAPRDASQAPTHIDPKARSTPQPMPRQVSQPPDTTSAKLLVIASLMSLVVVVLSLAVLSKTTGLMTPVRMDPVPEAETVMIPVEPMPREAGEAPKADLMLSLDVEPKDASLVVQPTDTGYEVKVAASGYQAETRTVEKGVTGKIAIKLEPAPKKAARSKAKKRSKPKKTRSKPKPKTDAEVFLTGSDL